MSKIVFFIKWLAFSVLDFLVVSKKAPVSKTLLLVRLDAIGDYVLFRNFIQILKNSHQYKDYKITLCGNVVWKELAENLDKNFIDEFIWLDTKKFTRNLWYRCKKVQALTATGYEVVISPVYSREFFHSDNVVKLVSATEKIGSVGDLLNTTELKKAIADRYYTKLIPATPGLLFEFYRNREFFNVLLNQQVSLNKPSINLVNIPLEFSLPQSFAVLFIGASKSTKKWPVSYFVDVADYLTEKYGLEILVCGGVGDLPDAKEFSRLFQKKYLDLVGQTTLLQLLRILKNAELLISNDTSAPHFAVGLDSANVIMISNGNGFMRFAPYPKDVTTKFHTVFHQTIEKDLAAYASFCIHHQGESVLEISEIPVCRVLNKIDQIIARP